MAEIESYNFGRMSIGGKIYTKDIIIYPDNSVLCPWWRISGHRLEITDIETLVCKNPETIVAGTGASGLMIPSKELQDFLRLKNIEFLALPTREAVQMYNELAQVKSTGGCFHLTC